MASFFSRKCIAFMLAISILYCRPLQAQKNTYTLQDLTNASEQNLPLFKQQQSLINSAQANVVDIKHSFLPQLKISDQLMVGSDNSIPGSYLPITQVPSVSSGNRNVNNSNPASGNIAVLYGEYELVNFGLTSAKVNTAETFVELQKADYKKQLYQTKLQLCQLYFSLLKNQYKLNVDIQNIERYKTIFSIISAFTQSGIKAGVDSSLAKAELASTQINYNQTLGRIAELKQQISYYTGIPIAQLQIDTLQSSVMVSDIFMPDMVFDSINNPLIDFYDKKKNVFNSNEQLIKKSYQPKIMLGAGTWARGSSITYNDEYQSLANGLGYQRFNYAAGVSIVYDLFNGTHKRDKLSINRYQIQASDFELAQQKFALNSVSLQADETIKMTMQNLLQLPTQLKSAEDVYLQKTAQYKAGLVNLIDLTNATFVLYRSQTDYIEALNDYYTAKLKKAAATGNLDQFIQSLK